MEAIISELILSDFGILECDYSFIVGNVEKLFSTDKFSKYPIDIDFDINELEELLRVFMTIKVNYSENPLDGYSISVKAAGLFKFKKGTKEEERQSLIPSAVSITINNIRGFLSSLTGACPYGRYIFPAIDLGDIISKKNKIEQEKLTPKKSVKKNTVKKNKSAKKELEVGH